MRHPLQLVGSQVPGQENHIYKILRSRSIINKSFTKKYDTHVPAQSFMFRISLIDTSNQAHQWTAWMRCQELVGRQAADAGAGEGAGAGLNDTGEVEAMKHDRLLSHSGEVCLCL